MKNFTKALMVAGVALSMAACSSITPDNTNYVEDADIHAVKTSPVKAAKAMVSDRSARIERAYNDSLRK